MDDNSVTNNQGRQSGEGRGAAPEGTGYSTPGADRIIQSSSEAVPSPSASMEQRLTTPKGTITSLGETPADANPALAQTVAEESGQGTTAEMLLARETAEEQYLRNAQANIYQDQGPDTMDRQFSKSDSGQPDSPYAYQEDATTRSIDSTDVTESFEGMAQGIGSMDLRARAESMLDRDGSQTAYTDAMSGQGPVGHKAEEYDAQGAEMHNTSVPGDLDVLAPGMKNIPDEG